jgi:hypothetical protein
MARHAIAAAGAANVRPKQQMDGVKVVVVVVATVD